MSMPSEDLFRSPSAAGVPFSQDDLVSVFDVKTIQRGRTLLLGGTVRLGAAATRIEATVFDVGRTLAVTITPMRQGRRVSFERSCGCGRSACAHMAAAAMFALDTKPEWRHTSLFDVMDKEPTEGKSVSSPPVLLTRWTLEAGREDIALFVTATLIPIKGEDAGTPASPRDVIAKVARTIEGDADRAIARLLGSGGLIRTPVAKGRGEALDRILRRLLGSRRLHWHTGIELTEGPSRVLRAFRDPHTRKLRPSGVPEGGMLFRGAGWWCIDPGAGLLCPITMQVVEAPKTIQGAKTALAPALKTTPVAKASRPIAPVRPTPVRSAPIRPEPPSLRIPDEAAIVERTPIIIARLGRVVSPNDGLVDALRLSFDYGEPDRPSEIEPDDQRQFARTEEPDGAVLFIRRDKAAEQAALDRLTRIGFSQARIEPPKGSINARGTRVHWFTGRDVAERWQEMLAVHFPALRADGWVMDVGADFGIRIVEPGREVAVVVRDAGDGWFDLDVGVEIDGERRPLLPILAKLIDRGGMAATRIIDDRAHIVLDDGSVLALPADRVERLLSVLESMLEGARRVADRIEVPILEADTLLDIDDLITRRPDEMVQIDAFLSRIRDNGALPEVETPPGFQGELRDYQREGLAWLQGLRAGNVAGILADDMGLGKTAQTLAHIAIEHAEGRLTAPSLVVVPTSLVPNWVDEAKRFTPHLRTLVLHGLGRHERRSEVDSAHIVVTTYGVIARDLDLMKGMTWHLLVLDEAQAIKNPDSKATRAVCQLLSRHRLCLSGTPVENNLGELWSQFAFLMPGLLGDRKTFQKRFRTPIEKRGDATRASLLLRRTKPFLLRRTKVDVAKELPPKTEVIRRIELDPGQRDLYETIRLSVHEKVRAAIAASGLSRNAITVIDALLKLRQVCCDPRLVKLATGSKARSAKLESLIEMVQEMVSEGRRILLFSQFTSMLDLIKVELEATGIAYVELTGRTLDRALPVARFQRGEVPMFLISLKAGGRGLNLTAADTVIHYDPWWNPAAEDQATDRAYRIGQDKPVFVYKLIAANTVEERILDLQRRKGSLSAATIEGTGSLVGSLDGGEIDYLFERSEEA